ncbi:MAG: DUF2089 domain-containing protein [Desulfobacterales bacterium]
MTSGWDELTGLTGGKTFTINRVQVKDTDIAIEGNFELPPLAQLSYNDQVFVAMFVRFHGSIKQMEEAFGISYPTVKARLKKIAEKLAFVEITTVSSREVVLDQLERGEITADEAAERLI